MHIKTPVLPPTQLAICPSPIYIPICPGFWPHTVHGSIFGFELLCENTAAPGTILSSVENLIFALSAASCAQF